VKGPLLVHTLPRLFPLPLLLLPFGVSSPAAEEAAEEKEKEERHIFKRRRWRWLERQRRRRSNAKMGFFKGATRASTLQMKRAQKGQKKVSLPSPILPFKCGEWRMEGSTFGRCRLLRPTVK